MRIVILAALIIGAFLVVGKEDDTKYKKSSNEVNWSNYHNLVKERIDKAILGKDCIALQKEFTSAADNSSTQRKRTGESNTKLMSYLNETMKKVGCYK